MIMHNLRTTSVDQEVHLKNKMKKMSQIKKEKILYHQPMENK